MINCCSVVHSNQLIKSWFQWSRTYQHEKQCRRRRERRRIEGIYSYNDIWSTTRREMTNSKNVVYWWLKRICYCSSFFPSRRIIFHLKLTSNGLFFLFLLSLISILFFWCVLEKNDDSLFFPTKSREYDHPHHHHHPSFGYETSSSSSSLPPPQFHFSNRHWVDDTNICFYLAGNKLWEGNKTLEDLSFDTITNLVYCRSSFYMKARKKKRTRDKEKLLVIFDISYSFQHTWHFHWLNTYRERYLHILLMNREHPYLFFPHRRDFLIVSRWSVFSFDRINSNSG